MINPILLGSFEIDDVLEFRRLLDRKVKRLRAFQNLIYVDSGAPEGLIPVDSI